VNLPELEKQLHEEGCRNTFVWEDVPDRRYSDHTHPVETAHIILEGAMTVTMHGQSTTYRAGDRCDVPAGITHAARMGPAGCRYLIGEK
jgi:mannose-6-phosphate isomerase-like protein (cupin superfamily)